MDLYPISRMQTLNHASVSSGESARNKWLNRKTFDRNQSPSVNDAHATLYILAIEFSIKRLN